MLDHVERRRLPVEPAGEDSLITALAVAHVELDESAGQLLHLPRRGRLAGAQPHDHIAGTGGLAGAELKLAPLAVALVEQAQDRDPLGHRRRAGGEPRHGLGNVNRLDVSREIVTPVDLGRPGRAAGGQRGERDKAGQSPDHASSGVQA
jgi:hypothetical protein